MMAAATANMDIMLLLLEHNTDVNIVSQVCSIYRFVGNIPCKYLILHEVLIRKV